MYMHIRYVTQKLNFSPDYRADIPHISVRSSAAVHAGNWHIPHRSISQFCGIRAYRITGLGIQQSKLLYIPTDLFGLMVQYSLA